MKQISFELHGRTFSAYECLNEANTEVFVRVKLISGDWPDHRQWNEANRTAKRLVRESANV